MAGVGVYAGAEISSVLGTENFTRSPNQVQSAQQDFKAAAFNPNEQSSFQHIIKHEI